MTFTGKLSTFVSDKTILHSMLETAAVSQEKKQYFTMFSE